MVEWSGGYCGYPFKGYRRVTQIDTLSPRKFNMVIDVMFWRWIMFLMEEAVVSYGFEMEIHNMASFFYMDYGLIKSTCPDWIQWAVDFLTGIFEWVGVWKSYGNTVGLVFHTCHIFQELQHSVWAIDDRGGVNLLVPPVTICPVPVLIGRHYRRVAGNTPKDT